MSLTPTAPLPPGWFAWERILGLYRPDTPTARAALAWLDMRAAPAAAYGLLHTLHPFEQTMLATLPSAARRLGFLHGRLVARRALASLLGPDDIRKLHIRSGVFGRPDVWEKDGRACCHTISISHRNGLACALAFPREQPMGVDIELPDTEALPAIAAQTSLAEWQLLTTVAPDLGLDRAGGLTLLWCAHEALGKALGCGLTVPAEFLEVSHLGAAIPLAAGLPGSSGPGWRGEYRHFLQYGLHAWRLGAAGLVLALPRRTCLT